MPWRAGMDPRSRIIEVAYSGSVTPEEIRSCVERVIALMRDERTSHVLMELDDATRIDAGTVDIVNLPSLYLSLGLPGPFRQAIVVSPQAPTFDLAAFYETVCINRGHAVRIFPDRERALAWLGTPPPP